MDDTEDNSPDAEEAPAKKRLNVQWQVIGLILLLLILMTTSVVTALMATGIIDIYPDEHGPVNSMTDAQFICDQELQAEHGELMQMFVLDDLSSHSDDKRGGYKLYYEMNMYRDASRSTGVNKFYINCFVSAGGRIKRMELFEEKEYAPKAGRRSQGNAIGL